MEQKEKMKTDTILIVGAVAIIAIIILSNPESTINFPWPQFSTGGNNSTNYYNNTQNPQETSRAPTSLYVNVEPNPMTMKHRVIGTVTSDGFKYGITLHAKHLGANKEQSFGGLLDDNGQFILSQTVDLPGYWNFWATAGSVKSNTFALTVAGIATATTKDHVTMSSPGNNIAVFSHYTGACEVVAIDHAHSVTIPLLLITLNSGGYGVFGVDWSSIGVGTYEINAVTHGESASTYGGTCWVTVDP